MSNSYPHSKGYFPPAPILEIQLSTPDSAPLNETLSAMIDTGGDITLVPIKYLEDIAAPELDEVRLRSHWGEQIMTTTYLVDITLATGLLPGVEVVGDLHGQEILLGRNVLNKVLLLLDGPHLLTEIGMRRP